MILTAILVVCTERTIITIGTAFIGATVVVIGIDVFARTGLTAAITTLLQYSLPPASSIPAKAWGLAGGGIVLAIVGAMVQFKAPHVRKHEKWRSAHGTPMIVTSHAPAPYTNQPIAGPHTPTHGHMQLPPAFLPINHADAPEMTHRDRGMGSPSGRSFLQGMSPQLSARLDALWNGGVARGGDLEAGQRYLGRDDGEIKMRYVS